MAHGLWWFDPNERPCRAHAIFGLVTLMWRLRQLRDAFGGKVFLTKRKGPSRTPAPTLQDGTIGMRAIASADRDFLIALHADAQVRAYLGGPVPQDAMAAKIRAVLTSAEACPFWCVTEDATPVGLVSLTPNRGGGIELSYQFLPSVWGRGVALRACAMAVAYGFSEMSLSQITAETQAKNRRSVALLTRLGMAERQRLQRFDAEQIIFAKDAPA